MTREREILNQVLGHILTALENLGQDIGEARGLLNINVCERCGRDIEGNINVGQRGGLYHEDCYYAGID